MKTGIRSLTLLFLLLCASKGFSQKPQTALELNDYLVTITDSLYYYGQQWGHKLQEVNETKKFSLLTPYREKIILFVDKKRREVVKMQDIGGSEELRLAMLDFLSFEKKMISETFSAIERLNAGSTDTEINTALEKLTNEAQKEEEVLKVVSGAQREYGKKNGFTIEGDDDEGSY